MLLTHLTLFISLTAAAAIPAPVEPGTLQTRGRFDVTITDPEKLAHDIKDGAGGAYQGFQTGDGASDRHKKEQENHNWCQAKPKECHEQNPQQWCNQHPKQCQEQIPQMFCKQHPKKCEKAQGSA